MKLGGFKYKTLECFIVPTITIYRCGFRKEHRTLASMSMTYYIEFKILKTTFGLKLSFF